MSRTVRVPELCLALLLTHVFRERNTLFRQRLLLFGHRPPPGIAFWPCRLLSVRVTGRYSRSYRFRVDAEIAGGSHAAVPRTK
jgi:hypothetical protein